jgi:hypothetical protein
VVVVVTVVLAELVILLILLQYQDMAAAANGAARLAAQTVMHGAAVTLAMVVALAETVNHGAAVAELVDTLDEAAITVNGHRVAVAHQAEQTIVVTLALVLVAVLEYTDKEAQVKGFTRHGAAKTHQVAAAPAVAEDKLVDGDKIHGTALALNPIISMAARTVEAGADLVQVGLHHQATVP